MKIVKNFRYIVFLSFVLSGVQLFAGHKTWNNSGCIAGRQKRNYGNANRRKLKRSLDGSCKKGLFNGIGKQQKKENFVNQFSRLKPIKKYYIAIVVGPNPTIEYYTE